MARYLRYRDLKPLKGIPFSRQHIRRLQKALKFPLSVSFGDNTEVFVEHEIDQWMADRIAERDAKAAALAAQHACLRAARWSGRRCGASQKFARAPPPAQGRPRLPHNLKKREAGPGQGVRPRISHSGREH